MDLDQGLFHGSRIGQLEPARQPLTNSGSQEPGLGRSSSPSALEQWIIPVGPSGLRIEESGLPPSSLHPKPPLFYIGGSGGIHLLHPTVLVRTCHPRWLSPNNVGRVKFATDVCLKAGDVRNLETWYAPTWVGVVVWWRLTVLLSGSSLRCYPLQVVVHMPQSFTYVRIDAVYVLQFLDAHVYSRDPLFNWALPLIICQSLFFCLPWYLRHKSSMQKYGF